MEVEPGPDAVFLDEGPVPCYFSWISVVVKRYSLLLWDVLIRRIELVGESVEDALKAGVLQK